MIKKNLLFVFFILSFGGVLFGQNTEVSLHPEPILNKSADDANIFSGNLHIDQKVSFDAVQKAFTVKNLNFQDKDRKSPWLGTLFSFILPGAGEFYAESYWKAGIFVALEAAVITTAVIYNKKGNDETDSFERFADNVTPTTGWSVSKYAHWLVLHKGELGLPQDLTDEQIITNPTAPHPWEQVDFAKLNYYESLVPELSHQLAPYGDQQYYEMIGKYHQFRAGWADYDVSSIDFNVSPLFHEYTGMRATANDYYNTASKAVIGIYINHFLSAIDAYWSTTIYNKELIAKITVENKQFADLIELVPTLKVKLSF
jgi:hypothetical protein